MQYTIKRTAGVVSVDGVTRSNIDMASMPEGVVVARWFGDQGELDYTDEASPSITRRRRFTNPADFQAILDLHALAGIPVPPTIAEVRLTKWAEMKLAREAAITEPLTTPYGVFDADRLSQTNITNAILLLQNLAALGTPDTVDFTLANNSTVTLTTAQMVQVGVCLGAQSQAAYAMGVLKRAAIEAATTIAAVEAITWS